MAAPSGGSDVVDETQRNILILFTVYMYPHDEVGVNVYSQVTDGCHRVNCSPSVNSGGRQLILAMLVAHQRTSDLGFVWIRLESV